MNTGSALARFTITLSQAVTEPVQVDWFTSDGTAKAGVDYAANKGTVVFAPGETAKTVDILVYGRAVGSEDRSFFVEMLPPTNAILGASIGECIITVDTSGSTPVTAIIVPTGPKGEKGDPGEDGVSPDPAEIAIEVAPLIDVGATVLTAQGTETLGHPDQTTVKAVARRVAYAANAKIATATLADGSNTLSTGDLTGDAVDFFGAGFYPRILRSGSMISPVWKTNSNGTITISGAIAGDVLYAIQYDLVSDFNSRRSVLAAVDVDYETGHYKKHKSFELGSNEIITASDALLWSGAPVGQGPYFIWTGALPKTVPVGSTPATTGGVAFGAWKDVGNATLESDLGKSDGERFIGICPSIAALRSIEPVANGQRITLREHTAGTGKGGGQFRAVLDGSAYTDNNGSIIKTSQGSAWLRINSDVLNPLMFGALGDGVANDTLALQNMLSAAALLSYTKVRIPAGVYLSAALTVAANSLVIEGDGKYPGKSGTTVRAVAANTTLFTFTGYGSRLTKMHLDGFENTNTFGANATCTAGLYQRDTADIDSFADDLVISNMKFGLKGIGRNLTQENMLYSNTIFPITLQYFPGEQFRGHIIRNVRFHSCGGDDANTNTTDTSRAGSVCINLIVNPATGTLADNYAGNISISDIIMDGGCFQLFKGSFGRGSVMNGVSMLRSGGGGAVLIKIDNTPRAADTASDGFTLSNINSGNDLNYSSTLLQQPDTALALIGCKGGVITSSLFSKMLKHGITLSNCESVLIDDMELKNPGFAVTNDGVIYDAINIDATCSNILLGNLIVRCTQAATQLRSIVNCAGTAHFCAEPLIAGNYQNLVLETGTGRVTGNWMSGSLASKKKIVYASAISTIPDGNYAVNDEVHFQPLPTTGTVYKGAICVTAGTKATAVWRSFGQLV